MKSKILGSIAVVVTAVIAVMNANLGSESDKLSAVSLANVEALAQNEKDYNTKDKENYYNCEVGSPNIFADVVRWCGSCEGTRVVISGTGKCKKN
jgi:hypothetical protein